MEFSGIGGGDFFRFLLDEIRINRRNERFKITFTGFRLFSVNFPHRALRRQFRRCHAAAGAGDFGNDGSDFRFEPFAVRRNLSLWIAWLAAFIFAVGRVAAIFSWLSAARSGRQSDGAAFANAGLGRLARRRVFAFRRKAHLD